MLFAYSKVQFHLIDWVVHHRELYRPSELAFGGIDADGLREFTRLFTIGGVDAVRFIRGRLESFFRKILEDDEWHESDQKPER